MYEQNERCDIRCIYLVRDEDESQRQGGEGEKKDIDAAESPWPNSFLKSFIQQKSIHVDIESAPHSKISNKQNKTIS